MPEPLTEEDKAAFEQVEEFIDLYWTPERMSPPLSALKSLLRLAKFRPVIDDALFARVEERLLDNDGRPVPAHVSVRIDAGVLRFLVAAAKTGPVVDDARVERTARAMEPEAFQTFDHGYTCANAIDERRFLNAERTVKRTRKKARAALVAALEGEG